MCKPKQRRGWRQTRAYFAGLILGGMLLPSASQAMTLQLSGNDAPPDDTSNSGLSLFNLFDPIPQNNFSFLNVTAEITPGVITDQYDISLRGRLFGNALDGSLIPVPTDESNWTLGVTYSGAVLESDGVYRVYAGTGSISGGVFPGHLLSVAPVFWSAPSDLSSTPGLDESQDCIVSSQNQSGQMNICGVELGIPPGTSTGSLIFELDPAGVIPTVQSLVHGACDPQDPDNTSQAGGCSGFYNSDAELVNAIRADNGAPLLSGNWSFRVSAVVPEPDMLALLGLGLAAMGARRVRRSSRRSR